MRLFGLIALPNVSPLVEITITNADLTGATLTGVKGIDCKKSSDKQKFISDETTIGIDGKKGSC